MDNNFAANISKHYGLPWTGLIEHCRKTKKDKPPDDHSAGASKSKSITTRLLKEDASTFGLRPALDECLLSVCGKCGAVIKPQALYSHIEKRHSGGNDGTSVQHLLTEKPIIKGPALKSRNKNSPRNSPKLATNCDTNLLDKYKLPKPPINRIGGKFAPGSLERTNSALAKHLSSSSAQPVVALDDVGQTLGASISPSGGYCPSIESRSGLALTPKSSLSARDLSSPPSCKKLTYKRSLDSSLSKHSKSEPPKKVKSELKVNINMTIEESIKEEVKSIVATESSIKPASSSQLPTLIDNGSPKATLNIPEPVVEVAAATCPENLKPPIMSKVHQLTTFDKSIPCKDREYDPNRHCGCWLEDWGKHCTRSLTCKSHALSLRRKVPGRSKPFDTLLQDHRDAKVALGIQLSKAKINKPVNSSSNLTSTKVHRPNNIQRQISVLEECEMDTSEPAHTQTECLGYTSFHPRPLSAPSYGARLCGNSFAPNRQMDILRLALKLAIDQPKQNKKSCSTKNVKSVNTVGVGRANQASRDQSASAAALNSSLALFHKAQSAAKSKVLSEKKRKKRSSTDSEQPSRISQPFAHRMASPNSVPPSPSGHHHSGMMLTPDAASPSSLPMKSSLGSASSATINVLTNGTTAYRANNMLKDMGMRQNVNQIKLGNRNSINLTTNASGIATLANKHLTILDGVQYAVTYPNSGASNSHEQTIPASQSMLINSSDILARATNGIVMPNSSRNSRLDNQSTLVELVPRSSIAHLTPTQHNLSNIHYIKSAGNTSASDANFVQSANVGDKRQQFTVSNGSALATFSSHVRAMQMKQQSKPNISMTIPLVSQASLTQQQSLHHSGSSGGTTAAAATATVHQGYS